MHERIGDQLAESLLGKHLHLFAHRLLDEAILWRRRMYELDQTGEPDRVTASTRLVLPRHELPRAFVDHNPRCLPCQGRTKRLQSFRQQYGGEI